MDGAGRVVLPKKLRREFSLEAGDRLRVLVDATGIRLEPVSETGELVRKENVLVFRGEFSEPISSPRIESMIAEDRERSAPLPKLKTRKG